MPEGMLLAWAFPSGTAEACWLVLGVLGLIGSILFSGLETGLYTLSRLRLQLRCYQKDAAALQISRWMEDPGNILGGLLIWQNISNYMVSAAITMLMERDRFGPAAETILSGIVIAPLMLIFAEIVPKDLFYSYTDRWTYHLVRPIRWSMAVITVIPVLPLVRWLGAASLRMLRGKSDPMENGSPPHRLLRIAQESTASGLISDAQQELISRSLHMAHIAVREVMIPWNRVIGVPVGISAKGFEAIARRYNHSRLPVLGHSADEVLGVVNVVDILAEWPSFSLQANLDRIITLLPDQSVRSSLTLMQKARQTIAVVVNRNGKAIGLVTIKDLVEELLGELADW